MEGFSLIRGKEEEEEKRDEEEERTGGKEGEQTKRNGNQLG